jgi:hypothetical protein
MVSSQLPLEVRGESPWLPRCARQAINFERPGLRPGRLTELGRTPAVQRAAPA